jgi:phosphinothricin acetyltransferase
VSVRPEPRVRPATPADLPALTDLYNHYVLSSPNTFDIEPYTVEARRSWFEQFADSGPYRLLVCEDSTGIAGYASSARFRAKAAYATSVETSVYLAPSRVGQGLGTDLYRALFERLRGEDLHRAYGGITLPNPASVALHRKLGFRSIGIYREVGRKLGRYWDVEWFEKPLRA